MMSRLMLAVVLFAGVLSQGCSTPPSSAYGQTDDSYSMMREEAWSAYNSCLERLGAYGRAYECDNVNSGYGYQTQQNRDYYQPTEMQSPYQYYGYRTPSPYYVWTAEPADVEVMKDQWLSLAEDPEKAL